MTDEAFLFSMMLAIAVIVAVAELLVYLGLRPILKSAYGYWQQGRSLWGTFNLGLGLLGSGLLAAAVGRSIAEPPREIHSWVYSTAAILADFGVVCMTLGFFLLGIWLCRVSLQGRRRENSSRIFNTPLALRLGLLFMLIASLTSIVAILTVIPDVFLAIIICMSLITFC